MTLPPTLPPPLRIGVDDGPWPLHDSAGARAAEAVALARVPPHTLMQRAGLAVARVALAIAPHARSIQLLAGPGNNGGDALVAALALQHAGKAVRVELLADPQRLPADAARALQRAQAAGVVIEQRACALDEAELVIDGLLGLGTNRPPHGPLAAAIARINSAQAPVLAIDLPSGLNADTGRPVGEHAVRALATLSLLTLKPGLFTADGRDHAGCVWFDPLGADAHAVPPRAVLTGAAEARLALPPRRHAMHKGSFGDVHVVGGAVGMTGAAHLAARAALAAGAGRVYLSLLAAEGPGIDAGWPELMLRPQAWRLPPAALGQATVVCGCGGGQAVHETLPSLLSQAGRLVLDADALNAIALDPSLQTLLAARAQRGRATVLTPHPLEAARLLGCTAAAVQQDRLAAAQALADRHGCTVLLKGSGSVVAAPGVLPSINPTGNAMLASAGTGDVLAGWIGGLWSTQAGSAHPAAPPWPVVRAAVWLHGLAADRAAQRTGAALPLHASALIESMRAAAARP